MSTKIYNGYRSKTIKTLEEALIYFKEFFPIIEKVTEEIVWTSFSLQASKIYDKITAQILDPTSDEGILTFKAVYENESSANLLPIILRDYRKIVEKANNSSTKDADALECSVVFIPLKGRILVLYYGNTGPEYLEAFESLAEVEDYHYQNSTDKPNSISQKAWNKRKFDWNLALGNSSGIRSGLTYELMNYDLSWKSFSHSTEDMISKQPSLEYRKKFIVDLLINKHNPHFDLLKENNSISDFFMKSNEWKKTAEYKQLYTNYSKIELKPVLTKEDFDLKFLKENLDDQIKKQNSE